MSSTKLIVGAAMVAMTFAVAGFASAQKSETKKAPPPHHQTATHEQKTPSEQGHHEKAQMQHERGKTAVRLNRDQIKQVQSALKQKALYEGPVDGILGPKTSQALRTFQQQRSLSVTGQADRETASALGLKWERQPVRGEETAKGMKQAERKYQVGREKGAEHETRYELSAMGQDQAKMLQQKLQQLGVYKGPIDGTTGAPTRAALQDYFRRQTQLARQGWISESGLRAFGMTPERTRERAPKGQTKPMK